MQFLENHPFLAPLLIEAYDHIKKHFTDAQLFLEVVPDPEAVGKDQLVVYISPNVEPDEASERLDRFDDEWWLDALEEAKGKLCITLYFS